MRRIALLVLLVSVTSTGCPTEGGEDAPPDSHAWYQGTSQATKPDGDPLGDASDKLLRRSVLPTVARIEEQVVEQDVNGDPIEVIATLTVVPEDSTFRVSFQDAYGLLEGNGLLSGGDDWDWTFWESTVVYQTGDLEGTTIQTEAELANGVLVSDTTIIDADGDLTVLVHSELQTVTEAAWQSAYAALIGG